MGQMMGHLSALDEMRPSPFAHNDASALCPLGRVTAQRSLKGLGPRWPAPAALPGSFATSSEYLLNCTSRMPVNPGVKIDKHKLERDMLINAL